MSVHRQAVIHIGGGRSHRVWRGCTKHSEGRRGGQRRHCCNSPKAASRPAIRYACKLLMAISSAPASVALPPMKPVASAESEPIVEGKKLVTAPSAQTPLEHHCATLWAMGTLYLGGLIEKPYKATQSHIHNSHNSHTHNSNKICFK